MENSNTLTTYAPPAKADAKANKLSPVDFVSVLTTQFESMTKDAGITLTEYGKTCALTAISAIINASKEKGIDLSQVSRIQLLYAVQRAALSELNIASTPPELFIDYHKAGKTSPATLSLTIQGEGWERLVRNWYPDLKSMSDAWIIREGDDFTLPYYSDEGMVGATWRPKFDSTKRALFVVYVITKTDGTKNYAIADREGVKANLLAHLHNNLRWDTTGAWGRISKKAENLSLDEMLRDEEIAGLASPAWKEISSREAMVIRKMKNNALRKLPLRFKTPEQAMAAQELDGDVDRVAVEETKEIQEHGARPLPKAEDFDFENVPQSAENPTADKVIDLDDETPQTAPQAIKQGGAEESQASVFDFTEDDMPF